MARLLWLLAVILISVTIYAVIDCAQRDRSTIKAMPKPAWFAVIILLPAIGVIMWFLFGRSYGGRQPSGPMAPDDDPDFLRKIAEQSNWEAERNRRRREAAAEDEPPQDAEAPEDAPSGEVQEEEPPSEDTDRSRHEEQREDRDAEN